MGNGLLNENAKQLLTHYHRGAFTKDDYKNLHKILEIMQYVTKPENCSRYYFYSMKYHSVSYFNNINKEKK